MTAADSLAASVPFATRDVMALVKAPTAELEAKMRAGTAPSFDDLLGWEFAGTNTGSITDLLGIRKFKKGFYEGPARVTQGPTPFIQGYNVVVRQNGIGAPYTARPSDASPKRHGFYRVHEVIEGARDAKYPNALLLDYGLGKNGADPSSLLRDYLVQIDPADKDLLLGKAYLSLLGMRIPAGFFILVRHNRHEFKGEMAKSTAAAAPLF
jgi:hypothetical protein